MKEIERLNLVEAERNVEKVYVDDSGEVQLYQAVPFKDRFEHLQALEHEAKILVEIGSRKSLPEDTQSDCEPDDKNYSGDLVSLRRIPLSELEDLLEKVESQNRRREILSIEKGKTFPFLEIIETYKLDEFERKIVLLLFMKHTANEFREMFPQSASSLIHRGNSGGISVGRILSILCRDFAEQLAARRYFSANSNLITNEIIVGRIDFFDELSCILDEEFFLHQRIANFIIGDNNAYSLDMTFISVDESRVSLDQVVLPCHYKNRVLETTDNFFSAANRSREMEMNDFYGYGTGLAILFHGPSGTGKTMMAHAIAKQYNRKMFQLNVAKANRFSVSLDEIIKYVFKEAKLADGIVFFDECDDLFNQDSHESRVLLMEIEKSECLTIMTTNRIYRLDPALDRRITLKVPFKLPDARERQKLWKALIHPGFELAEDVCFESLAEQYVFTGGLIKNTLMMVQNEALTQNRTTNPVISMKDLLKAADYQAEHLFQKVDSLSVFQPQGNIEDLPIGIGDREKLRKLVELIAHNYKKGIPLFINIVLTDLDLGRKCVEAACSGIGVHIRSFVAEEVMSENRKMEFIDPFTQKQVSLMKYFFQEKPGHFCFDLLMDVTEFFDGKKPKSNTDTASLIPFLEKCYGSDRIIFLVSRHAFQNKGIGSCDAVLKIGFPERKDQFDHWKRLIGKQDIEENRIENIVSRYPMYLKDIEGCVKKAKIMKTLSEREEEDIFSFIEQVQSSHYGQQSLLFGNSPN